VHLKTKLASVSTEHSSKARSLTIVTVAYVIAIGVGAAWLIAGPATGMALLDAFIADVLATGVIFAFSRAFKNSSFYDAYWSVVPPLLLLYWWLIATNPDTLRSLLIAIVVVLWAIRLTGNWIYAFPGLHHEDWRYPKFKASAGRWEFFADLFAIHLIPTVQVFLGMIPVYVAVTRPGPGLTWLAWTAFVVGIAAVAIEFVADLQMHRFVAAAPAGEVMDRGLWSWSRHPNYFGEFSFWLSLALFGVAAAPADWWWLGIGAFAMLAMFLGASIPMMEERSLERRPNYAQVVERIPRFVPRPPRTREVRSTPMDEA
jgi:steroid 5-alpha reductase family enzyme